MNIRHQLFNYINWLFEKYKKAQKKLEALLPYRIMGIETNFSGNTSLKVHIFGTGKEISFAPEQLVINERMIEGFSKKDIILISYYAYNNLNKPKYKIVSTSYCEKLKKMFLGVKHNHSNEISKKTADEITSNQSIVESMSPKDAHRIGYISGTESILREYEEKNKLINNVLLRRENHG